MKLYGGRVTSDAPLRRAPDDGANARPDKRDPQEDRRARREVLREMRNRR